MSTKINSIEINFHLPYGNTDVFAFQMSDNRAIKGWCI